MRADAALKASGAGRVVFKRHYAARRGKSTRKAAALEGAIQLKRVADPRNRGGN